MNLKIVFLIFIQMFSGLTLSGIFYEIRIRSAYDIVLEVSIFVLTIVVFRVLKIISR